ncbi:MAG: hypothetical protein QME77_12990 [bacterium]|nr:hypothetical protein [bacterium]
MQPIRWLQRNFWVAATGAASLVGLLLVLSFSSQGDEIRIRLALWLYPSLLPRIGELQALEEENSRLKARGEQLESQNSALQAKIAGLEKESRALRQENSRLKEAVGQSPAGRQDRPAPIQASPQAAPVLQVFLEDDFEIPSGAWQAVLGDWVVENGVFGTRRGGSDLIALTGDAGWRNYAVDVDLVRLESLTSAGILVRVQDRNNYVQFRIRQELTAAYGINSVGEWILRKNGTDIGPTAKVVLGDASVLPLHIHVQVNGNVYMASARGKTSRFVDNQGFFPQGKVGLTITSSIGQSPAQFDNFRVARLR